MSGLVWVENQSGHLRATINKDLYFCIYKPNDVNRYALDINASYGYRESVDVYYSDNIETLKQKAEQIYQIIKE